MLLHVFPPRGAWAAVILFLLSGPLGLAQVTDVAGCEGALEAATERYTAGAFEDATILLEPCQHQTALPLELRREIFRLLILSNLRLGDRREARRLVGDLIELDPEYEPDPVLDPPDFVAFVNAERPVAAPPAPVAPAVPAVPAADPQVAQRPWLVSAHVGAGSYGGERGKPRGNPLADFLSNAGFSGGAALAVPVHSQLHLGARAQLHYLPTRFHYDFAGPTPLDRDASGPWTLALLAEGTWLFQTNAIAVPSARFGIGVALSYLNDSIRAGLILQPGFDVAMPVSPGWDAVLNFDLGVVLPGEALDLRNVSHIRSGTRAYDLITQIGAGVRYSLTR